MTDVDPPAIITQKEKTKIMLEPFSKGQQQQLVGAYSQVMAPCLASESPTGLVTREAHCTSARGSEAGAEGLRAGTHFGGEPRGAVQAYWSVQCRSAAAAPRG